MTSPLMFMNVDAPVFITFEMEERPAEECVGGWAEAGLAVRAVRGNKMRTEAAMYSEFAAALQFPWYFGENRDAFFDCLTDLSWLPPGAGYVVVVVGAHELLVDSSPDVHRWFAECLEEARAFWSEPADQGEPWERSAVSFHVVLQHSGRHGDDVASRWTQAGASLRHFAT